MPDAVEVTNTSLSQAWATRGLEGVEGFISRVFLFFAVFPPVLASTKLDGVAKGGAVLVGPLCSQGWHAQKRVAATVVDIH